MTKPILPKKTFQVLYNTPTNYPLHLVPYAESPVSYKAQPTQTVILCSRAQTISSLTFIAKHVPKPTVATVIYSLNIIIKIIG